MKTILVLGGGIAGVEAAIALSNEFKHRGGVNLKLISDRANLFIYPLSIWVAAGTRSSESISMPLHDLSQKRHFAFYQEKVERIESKHNRVITDKQTHAYDYLVVALGADKLKPSGIEHTLSICGGPQESEVIRDRFRKLPEGSTIACGFSGNPKDSTGVRGGPVFEILFNLDHWLRRQQRRDKYRLVFFSPAADAGKRLGGPGLKALEKLFAKHEIEPMVGKKIKAFQNDGIVWEDGRFLPTQLTLFTPGLQGPAILKNTDLPLTDAGFVPVNSHAQVVAPAGQEPAPDNCYVIGDSAAYDGPPWRAKQGHFAEVMAHVAAKNIRLRETGKPQSATFSGHFNILCIMDLGREAVFVYRDEHKAFAPKGIWAHWAKVGWEWYYKLNKKGLVPRLPM